MPLPRNRDQVSNAGFIFFFSWHVHTTILVHVRYDGGFCLMQQEPSRETVHVSIYKGVFLRKKKQNKQLSGKPTSSLHPHTY